MQSHSTFAALLDTDGNDVCPVGWNLSPCHLQAWLRWLLSQLNWHHLVAFRFHSLFPTLVKFKAAIHSCSQDVELQNTTGSFSSVQEDTDKYSDAFRWVKQGFVVLFTFIAEMAFVRTCCCCASLHHGGRVFLGFH